MIDDDLRTFILDDPDIEELVEDRYFPDQIPQTEALPAIVHQRITTGRDYHLEGQSELAAARIQLSAWAADPDTRTLLGDLIAKRVSGYRGVMGDSESRGVYVVNEIRDFEPDTGRYRALLDLRVWHTETAAVS